MPEPDRCPTAPAGESHRWKLPDQGEPGPARCRYCGAERTFTDARRNQWTPGRPPWKPRGARKAAE